MAFIVTRYKSKELTRKQSQQLELLEYEIRKEIREGRSKELYSAEVHSIISEMKCSRRSAHNINILIL